MPTSSAADAALACLRPPSLTSGAFGDCFLFFGMITSGPLKALRAVTAVSFLLKY